MYNSCAIIYGEKGVLLGYVVYIISNCRHATCLPVHELQKHLSLNFTLLIAFVSIGM